jgi:hypothetical protein
MPHYHIQKTNDPAADAYWVFAATPAEARHLIALNVTEAKDADNIDKFLCEPSQHKTPPAGLIYSRLTGPLTIERR